MVDGKSRKRQMFVVWKQEPGLSDVALAKSEAQAKGRMDP
jgi:hypothetical protein